MQRLNQTIADLIKGIEDSVIIHGDWQEYTETDVYIAVAGEFSEYFRRSPRSRSTANTAKLMSCGTWPLWRSLERDQRRVFADWSTALVSLSLRSVP